MEILLSYDLELAILSVAGWTKDNSSSWTPSAFVVVEPYQ